MMDYSTFKAVVEKKITEYLPENFKDAKVEVSKMMKVNRVKDAMTIRADDDTKIAPNFYLDDLYEQYQSCGDIESVLYHVADAYVSHTDQAKEMMVPELTKEFVEENVIMTMINTESNQELLAKIPHREFNDCSVIYRIVVSLDSKGLASTIVNHRIAEEYGMTEQELFARSCENTKRILPPKSEPLSHIIMDIKQTGLLKMSSRMDNILEKYSEGEDKKVTALREALSVLFSELEKYSAYVTDNTRFATHQGVKGLEFPRVMVIMDDASTRGFLFSYEKLFGAKAKTDTDIKNEREGNDTSITRTTRLFYVACTRAQKSLAVVAYTENTTSVKDTALSNGWFSEDEIQVFE